MWAYKSKCARNLNPKTNYGIGIWWGSSHGVCIIKSENFLPRICRTWAWMPLIRKHHLSMIILAPNQSQKWELSTYFARLHYLHLFHICITQSLQQCWIKSSYVFLRNSCNKDNVLLFFRKWVLFCGCNWANSLCISCIRHHLALSILLRERVCNNYYGLSLDFTQMGVGCFDNGCDKIDEFFQNGVITVAFRVVRKFVMGRFLKGFALPILLLTGLNRLFIWVKFNEDWSFIFILLKCH